MSVFLFSAVLGQLNHKELRSCGGGKGKEASGVLAEAGREWLKQNKTLVGCASAVI